MLAFGIIFVVIGHCYQPPYLFYPAYYFHIPLFFFISGYFFSIKTKIFEKFEWIWHKVKSQLLLYFLYNLLFALIAIFLLKFNIQTSTPLNFSNFFAEPFIYGHQHRFLAPAWFLITLFLSNVFLQVLIWKNHKLWILSLLAIFIVLNSYTLKEGLHYHKDLHLTYIKVAFGIMFMLIGKTFKIFEDKIRSIIINPITLIVLFISIDMIRVVWGKNMSLDMAIVGGSVANEHVYAPVISSLLIILIIYAICHYATFIVHDNSILIKIGQHSFDIMIWHIFVFFLINLTMVLLGFSYWGEMFVFYKSHILWPIYILNGTLLPVYTSIFIKRKFHFGANFRLKISDKVIPLIILCTTMLYSCNRNKLKMDEELRVNERLISNNRKFKLVLQNDGNLVLYKMIDSINPSTQHFDQAIWNSTTNNKPITKATMQKDGNFVLYDGVYTPYWATGTSGNTDAYLILQDDGNIVIYSGNKPVWSSNTVQN
jgi:fucose 4-O-acetylase-like acetyltransferase